MHHEQVEYANYDRDWQQLCYDRYCAAKFRVPFVNRRLRPIRRTFTLRHPVFTAMHTPFSGNFLCFAGEHWFCANRAAAEYLIGYHRTKPELSNYYRRRDIFTITPEESYYHAILCNAHFRVSQNNWRYIDWSEKTSHPKVLLTPKTQIERRNRRHESSRPRRASVSVRALSGTALNKNG